MTIKQDRENLAMVKLALADKYENLAATIKASHERRIISATSTSFAARPLDLPEFEQVGALSGLRAQ